jgi:hypothetical protein
MPLPREGEFVLGSFRFSAVHRLDAGCRPRDRCDRSCDQPVLSAPRSYENVPEDLRNTFRRLRLSVATPKNSTILFLGVGQS